MYLEFGSFLFLFFASKGSFFVGAQAFLASLALSSASQVSRLVFHLLVAPIFLFVVSVIVLEFLSWRLQAKQQVGERAWKHVEKLKHRQDVAAFLELRSSK